MAEDPSTASSRSQPPSSSSAQKSPSEDILPQSQVPIFSNFPAFPNGDFQMFPVMYPALVPGLNNLQNQEQINRGSGIYAVPVFSCMGHVTGLPSNTLVPLTYNIPTRQSPEAGSVGEERGQVGQQQQQPAPQRQVVRLVVLVVFASLVYLYQTGALTPIVRWLSQGMQRAAAPPPRPAVRAENVPPAARQGVENAAVAEGQPGAQVENQAGDGGNQAVENENLAEAGGGNGGANHWWGIVKEIQMIVFGFITSLLPGFHNID